MKAQDLKNSILQLAIQGKLVPQDASDEPAEVLYAKIQAEKQKLIKEGKIKKDKPLPPITDDEIPFEIPSTWKWVRLSDIVHSVPTKEYQILQSEILEQGKYPVVSQSQQLIEGYSNKVEKLYKHEKPVLIFGDHTRCLKLIDFDFIVGADGTKILYPYAINEKYLYYAIQYFIINMLNRGYSRHFQFIKDKEIPLPPLSEQKRIVAKIEELEPLVKQYDKAETELSALNGSFPEQLKKSILQYAIQGKLVAQDANDESAEALYAKIQAEKQRLIKEGKIKKDKPLPPITDDEIPFAIPSTWKWVRLKDIGIINPRNNLSDSIEVTFLPMNCIYSDFYRSIDTSNKKKWGEVKAGYTHIAENDVIMAKITPCFENGKSAVAKNLFNGYGAATTEIHVFRSIIELNLNYILMYLKSPFFMDYATKHMTGTAGQKRVPQNIFAEYFFPLPPLAEQKRIVAKVNELMKYCEELTHPEKRKEVEPITIEWLIDKGFDSCKQNGYTDVNAILDELNIAVMQDRNLKKGRIEYDNNKKKFQIWVNDLNDNWTKAHELVHYVNDNNEIKLYCAVGRKDETSLSKSKERNVDVLTAEILMPEDIFVSAVEQDNIGKYAFVDNATIRKLGKQFRVSDDAVKIRLQNLGYHTK